VSLYSLQKFIYHLNRDRDLQARFKADRAGAVAPYEFTDEERRAVLGGDVGLLYVLGVNGQLLMHFAALEGMPWPDYIQSMRDGVDRYGPVRAGIYAMTTHGDEKVAGV
jgi:hypothetical protein